MSHCQHKEKSEELKACPFCGKTDKLKHYDAYNIHQISCLRCQAWIETDTEEEAIQVWNRREHE